MLPKFSQIVNRLYAFIYETNHSKSGLGLPSIVALVMVIDKSWTCLGRCEKAFYTGLKAFVEHCRPLVNSFGNVKCPCKSCRNVLWVAIDNLSRHITNSRWDLSYKTWTHHGEPDLPLPVIHNTTQPQISDMTTCLNDLSYIPPNNEQNEPTQGDIGETSNEPTQAIHNEFEELHASVHEELYQGCDYVTRLDFMAKFTHFMVKGKLTDSIFNEMLEFFQFVFPPSKGYKLPSSYYAIKKTFKMIGLGYESIHACVNDYYLFRGEDNKDKQLCPVCNTIRWKDNHTTGKKVPKKVLRYFLIIPRLQCLYKSSHTTKEMTWHATGKCTEPGKMQHLVDGRAWKKFDTRYPKFAAELRNVQLGLVADGFNPFCNLSQSYNIWPVILTTYNLPPWLCMKESYLMLTVLIPDPRSRGIETIDVATCHKFNIRVMVLWTINDFPVRSSLSRWSRQGYMACPTCNEDTPSMLVRSCDFNGETEDGDPPREFNPDQILTQLNRLPTHEKGKHPSYRGAKIKRNVLVELNWTKRSIFYELNPEIDMYLAKFKSQFSNKDMKEEFPGWFGSQIRQRYINKDPCVSESGELFALACGPTPSPISVNSCVVNGVKFVIHSRDKHRTTQNSGICSPGEKDGEMYYGQLEEILEFSYMSFKVVLFRVKWFDTSNEGRKIKRFVIRNNITQIWAHEDDHDVIHFDNSSDLALSTSLDDLDFATLNIDGQSIDVDAPPDIIDVDDDLIDDEDTLPYDLADFDDEDLANDDDDVMSADVARGHDGDGGGDDRPPPLPIPTSCRGKNFRIIGTRKPSREGRKAGRLDTRGPTRNLGLKSITDKSGPVKIRFEFSDRGTLMPLGDHAAHWSNLLEEIVREFPMHYPAWRKIKPERKAGVMGLIRAQFDLMPHMQSDHSPDIYKGIQQQLAKIYTDNKSTLKKEHWVAKPDGTYDEEMLRLQDLGSNTPSGVPYTDDEINAQVHGGKQLGHIPSVGKVLAGKGMNVPIMPEPRCKHTADVDQVKNKNKHLQKQINMLMKVVRSDGKFSQMHTQLKSQPQVGSGSGGDDESGEDEDANDLEDKDADGDEDSYDILSTRHFLKFLENSFEVLKLLENNVEVLKILENKLESMKILENKLESLKLQENQPCDMFVVVMEYRATGGIGRNFGSRSPEIETLTYHVLATYG
ncbi:hypothetical protein Tco_1266003 [Tanacetum coccineum]